MFELGPRAETFAGVPVAHLHIHGRPSPGGSKKYVGHRGGRPIITDAGGKHTKKWRKDVARQAMEQYDGEPLEGPLFVDVLFRIARPMNHYVNNDRARPLKEKSPYYHFQIPDCLKLMRSTEDALSRIIWRDDCLISGQNPWKIWCHAEEQGADITVYELEPKG